MECRTIHLLDRNAMGCRETSVVKYTKYSPSKICTACRLYVRRSYTDEYKTISMSIDLRETFEQNRNHIMKKHGVE